MQPAEYEGIWWLPDAPENAVAGKLTFDQADVLELKTIGLFTDPLIGERTPEVYPLIYGRTTDSQDVTLCRCAQITWRMGTGVSTMTCSAQIAFVGAHFSSLAGARFRRAYAQFAHLAEWAHITGITQATQFDASGEYISRFTQAFSPPPEPAGAVENWDIRIAATSRASVDGYSTALIEQTISVHLDFHEPRGFEDILAGILHYVRDFLTLAVGAPTPMLGLTLERDDATRGRGNVEVLTRDPTRRLSNSALRSENMVFTLNDVSGSWPDPLCRMFEARVALRPTMDLYFAVVNNPNLYVEAKFLALVQALEAFHRRTQDQLVLPPDHFSAVAARLKHVLAEPDLKLAPDAQQVFTGRLMHWNDVSLRKRLRDIVRSLRPGALRTIGGDEHFVREAVETRNYLTHFDSRQDKLAPDIASLVNLVHKTQFLLEQCLLQMVGVSTAVLDRHAKRAREVARSIQII